MQARSQYIDALALKFDEIRARKKRVYNMIKAVGQVHWLSESFFNMFFNSPSVCFVQTHDTSDVIFRQERI